MAEREALALGASSKRRPGRPRSTACHSAILSATLELLEERRYADVTMESIAQRAGVSKQTLYKWWPAKVRLVMEANLARSDHDIPIPDTGAVRRDLEVFLIATCKLLSRKNTGTTVAGLIAEAQSDPEVAREFREVFVAARRAKAARMLERGIERGEVRASIDIPLLLDLLYGPIWYRLLLKNGPLDAAFARSIVENAFTTIRPGGDV